MPYLGYMPNVGFMPSGSRSPDPVGQIRCALAVVFVAVLLWWQGRSQVVQPQQDISLNKVKLSLSLRLAWSRSSSDRGLEMPLLCNLPRWMEQCEGGPEGACLNKLGGVVGDRNLAGILLLDRQGGGRRELAARRRSPGKLPMAAPGVHHAAAVLGCCDLWPRRRPPQSPVHLLCRCILNLHRWRPLYLDVVDHTLLRRSGAVPRAERSHHGSRRCNAGDAEEDDELDCFFPIFSRVFLVRILDLVLSSFSLEVLYVNVPSPN